jgi:hypothetical protein
MNDDAKLHDIAKRLGAQAAERIDVQKTAQAVLQRLREQPAARPSWVQTAWLRIAAALVIVVGGAYAVRRLWPSNDHRGDIAHFVADDLHDLSTDQLRDVLATLDETLERPSTVLPEGSADFDELNAQQLRAVLRTLEG